LNHNVSGREAV